MDACNLDAGGVRKRVVFGAVWLVLGVGFAIWSITTGQPLTMRIPAAFVCFLLASLSLFQARAKT